MNTNFTISQRIETPSRYDVNREINIIVEKALSASIEAFLREPYSYNIRPYISDESREWNSKENSEIRYSEYTTLGTSGCAIYALHQGLRLQRGIEISLAELAERVAEKGYYEPGKGTWHNLFDHMNLRRASDVREIFDTLETKFRPVITCLVINSKYPFSVSLNGNHFINLVGSTDEGLIIDDSSKSSSKFLECKDILPAIKVAWLW